MSPMLTLLGPPVVPIYPFLGEGSPTKIDYRKKGTLLLTFLLEDLDYMEHISHTTHQCIRIHCSFQSLRPRPRRPMARARCAPGSVFLTAKFASLLSTRVRLGTSYGWRAFFKGDPPKNDGFLFGLTLKSNN